MQDEIKIKFTGHGNLLDEIKKLDQATKKLLNTQAKITSFYKKTKERSDKYKNSLKTLRVQLQLQGKDLKDLKLPLSMYKDALRGNELALAKIKLATKGHIKSLKNQRKGLLDTEHGTRILGGAFSVLRSKLLLVNFALGLGIRQLFNFSKASSRVESMERAFNTLSGSFEGSTESLSKLQKATNNTMSEFDLFQQANNAMILGVTKNSDEMAEMFDIAQRLGRALGRDTASSVESLITGIGRQSRLMLDNIGIIVKSEEAYEKYAKKLKITTNQLTDAQKKQAFLEATLESARKKVNKLGDEVLISQDAYDQLSASTSDLATATGTFLQPAISFLARSFSDIAKNATTYLNTLTNVRKEITELTSLEEQETITLAKIKKLTEDINVIRRAGTPNPKLEDALKEENANLLKIRENYFSLRVADLNSIKLKEKLAKQNELIAKQENENILANQKRTTLLKEQQKIQEEFAKKEKERKEKEQKENLEAFQKINKAQGEIFKNNLDFQFLQIELQADKFREMKLNEVAITEFAEQAKHEAVLNNLEQNNIAYKSFMVGYDTFVKSLTDMEMSGKERREQIFEATKNAFIGFLGEMIKAKIQQIIIDKIITTSSQVGAVASAKATGLAIASSYAVPASLASTASFGASAVAGQSAINASVLATKALAKFEDGGLIGGRRHSQGGTIIEAERGEFVMSRNAVQSIGLETLNQMNQSGMGGGVTVNIHGGVVDESYVSNELIPAINKATSLGARVNA
jgi:hypothetical protein